MTGQTPTPQMIFLPDYDDDDDTGEYSWAVVGGSGHRVYTCFSYDDAKEYAAKHPAYTIRRLSPEPVEPMLQLWAALTGVQKPVQKPARVREAYPAPIAYTYDADYHCPGCTAERFGTDEEGWIVEYAEDSEGNRVGAVAPWDEWTEPSEPAPQFLVCGSCLGVIETYTD